MSKGRLRAVSGGASLFPLSVLFGLVLLDQATQSAFNVLIPNVRDTFHLSDVEILTIVALGGAAALLGTVPVAWLADRTVRVRIALIGGAVAAVFSVALGFAPTAVVLAITLCGIQLGQAVIFPTHNSLIADYYPVESRTRVYSTHRAGLSLGIVSGVLIGAGDSRWRRPRHPGDSRTSGGRGRLGRTRWRRRAGRLSCARRRGGVRRCWGVRWRR